MAAAELEAGSRLIYRNVNFNTYGFLNVREAFARSHPEEVQRVLSTYEKARRWILAHPEETAKILSEEAHLPLAVAKLQLQRTDFSNPLPGKEHADALRAAAPILNDEGLVKPGTDLARVVDELIDPAPAKQVAIVK